MIRVFVRSDLKVILRRGCDGRSILSQKVRLMDLRSWLRASSSSRSLSPRSRSLSLRSGNESEVSDKSLAFVHRKTSRVSSSSTPITITTTPSIVISTTTTTTTITNQHHHTANPSASSLTGSTGCRGGPALWSLRASARAARPGPAPPARACPHSGAGSSGRGRGSSRAPCGP